MSVAAHKEEVQVVVSAWGPAFGYPKTPVFDGEQFADQGPTVPHEKRAKIVIYATPCIELGAIIDQAATEFGVRSLDDRSVSAQVPCFAFFRDGDENGMAGGPDRWNSVIRTVDRDGSPSWALRWSEVQLGELLTASAAGTLDGDPRTTAQIASTTGIPEPQLEGFLWGWDMCSVKTNAGDPATMRPGMRYEPDWTSRTKATVRAR
jgi:hypothetical protein